jgi:uncharacterized protein
VTFVVGVGGNLLVFYLIHRSFTDNLYYLGVLGFTISIIVAPALSCCYGCTLVLLSQWGLGRRLLAPLAPVGQMALTNYLTQSIICTTLFYSYGFGLYAQIGPAAALGLCFLIFGVQVLWSNLWLRGLGFRFGPMEWLWRTLTYGRLQPMRAQVSRGVVSGE